MQIKTKLTLTYFLVTAGLLLLVLVLIYVSFKDQMEKQFYLSLRTNALMTFSMLEKSDYGFDNVSLYEADEKPLLNIKDNILIYNDQRQLIFAFMPEPTVDNAIIDMIRKDGEYKFPIGDFKAIGIRYKTPVNKEFVLIAKGKFISEELISLQRILIWIFFIVLFISAVAGYFNARSALMPIHAIMKDISTIRPDDLSARLKVGSNQDEITHLAEAFNALLFRIEDAFNLQKGFLSYISHEVRNPVASIISRIEVHTMKERTLEEYKSCLEPILSDAREIEQTAMQLMQLTRITAGAEPIVFAPVRLDQIVWDIYGKIKQINQKYTVQIDAENFPDDPDVLVINANEILIKTAMSNLIENACKYSKNHTASVRIYTDENRKPVIDIADNATLISDEEKSLIFKPFYRRSTDKNIKGSGIGLSLVALIMKVHNYRLNILGHGGSGNIFTLTFSSDQPINL